MTHMISKFGEEEFDQEMLTKARRAGKVLIELGNEKDNERVSGALRNTGRFTSLGGNRYVVSPETQLPRLREAKIPIRKITA